MAQYGFGAGVLWGIRNDQTGGTSRRFGAMQDISIDFAGESKELFGGSQFPLDVARAKMKIQCKAKFAEIQPSLYNDLFWGQTQLTTGSVNIANSEVSTTGSSTGSTSTLVAANASTFTLDLGVRYAATGVPLKLVASAPTVGQYAVAGTGTYTMSSADASTAMLIDYEYSITGTGTIINGTNPLMGQAPRFMATFSESYENKNIVLTLYSCMSSKLSMPTKIDDYIIGEMDFEAYANAAGQVFQFSTTAT
jgi:hypothetical protein